MKPHTLYVIGNGFDIWHNIPSKFKHFKEYIRITDPYVFREIEEYLPFDEEWNKLESTLASIDAELLIDNLGHFMASYGADDWSDSGHHDFQYEVRKVIENLSTGLRIRFAEWIRSLPTPTAKSAPQRLTLGKADAVFFSFNYTSTLTTLYGIPQEYILFIHGCADIIENELVLGHAWNPQTRKSLNDHPDVSEMDTRLYEANGIIDEYFSITFKPSEKLIALNQNFFDDLTDIEQVIVLGHSLSDVDAAYFRALLKQRSVAEAQWIIACQPKDDWAEKCMKLSKLGIQPNNARPILWDAL